MDTYYNGAHFPMVHSGVHKCILSLIFLSFRTTLLECCCTAQHPRHKRKDFSKEGYTILLTSTEKTFIEHCLY